MRIAKVLLSILFIILVDQVAHAKDWQACAGGNVDLRIAGCSRIIDSNNSKPKDLAIAYRNRGISFNELEKYDRAIVDFTRAIELRGDYALAFNGRGFSYNKMGNYDHAIDDLNKAILLKPDYASAFSNRSQSYKFIGDYGKAISDLEKALELDPKLVWERKELAELKLIKSLRDEYLPKDIEGICRMALTADRTGWDKNFDPVVVEAHRRGLSIIDCNNAIQQSNSTQNNTIEPIDVCRIALRSDRTGWDYRVSNFVSRAVDAGYSVNQCRIMIGLPALFNIETESNE
jgi:tetratricopeptide (TPR) repeat protein